MARKLDPDRKIPSNRGVAIAAIVFILALAGRVAVAAGGYGAGQWYLTGWRGWLALVLGVIAFAAALVIRFRWSLGWARWGILDWWLGGRLADWMTGWRAKPVLPPEHSGPDLVSGHSHPITPVTSETGVTEWHAGATLPGVQPYYAPFPLRHEPDWPGFVDSMAIRLEEAIGPGFYAQGDGTDLLLRHAEESRRIPLEHLLAPPPPDAVARAMRVCVKMMDEAQMFKMQQLRQRWPLRDVRDDSSPDPSLPRPVVHLKDLELHLEWADERGTVRELPSLPFVEGHPEPDGPVRLA